ncbi:glycosyltransferase [candidate division WWE3 bacterium]|uniref:Glycosyltransferase n=1 Tax=candidate division WWE3 bacterium TaxID=2053526 RepID=A0A7X9HSU5_UNCKA|nr:glycosyltransferase [candidate division WWE3 bacterium]
MSKKNIFYKHPRLYTLGLKWIHKSNFAKRYRYMASFIREGDTVLEPACGPAILAGFLPKGSFYRGFDTNKNFLNYALKKCPSVYLGNVLNQESYCQADIVIACDILHHLKPTDRERFIQNCFSFTKKVFVICEPGKIRKTAKNIFYPLRKWIAEWSEEDGTNDVKSEYFFTHEQLLDQVIHGFGIIPPLIEREIKYFGEDIVTVFFKDKSYRQKLKTQEFVSAIVPVFNEEKTVAGVVEALLKSPLINEVICINDGSTDGTLSVLRKYKDKIQLINFKDNKGKGYALVEGIKKAKGEIVSFIDADLTNLSDNHIETLLEPVLGNKFRAVLGYPSNGWIPDVFSNLTGERVYYKKDLVPYLEEMTKTRFGVEVFLNNLFTENETKKIPLKKLRGLYKYEKRSSVNAFREYLGEAVEIAREIGKREGLIPEDYQAIAKVSKATSFKELRIRIKGVANKNVRHFLEKYVLNYIKTVQHWWKSF